MSAADELHACNTLQLHAACMRLRAAEVSVGVIEEHLTVLLSADGKPDRVAISIVAGELVGIRKNLHEAWGLVIESQK